MRDKVVYCTTDPHLQRPGTNHVPILMVLELPVEQEQKSLTRNFREVDWDEFRKELGARLDELQEEGPIQNEE